MGNLSHLHIPNAPRRPHVAQDAFHSSKALRASIHLFDVFELVAQIKRVEAAATLEVEGLLPVAQNVEPPRESVPAPHGAIESWHFSTLSVSKPSVPAQAAQCCVLTERAPTVRPLRIG